MNLFLKNYLKNFKLSLENIDLLKLEKAANILNNVRDKKGRLFVLGIGGSAGNSSHAVNDFRKLCNIQAYAPTDNVSEITARTNDEGFSTIFSEYLKISRIDSRDCLLIFSVGGGNIKKKVSINLIESIKYAKKTKTKIISFVGKKDGYAYKKSDISILISSPNDKFVTPVSESLQVVLWHALVSHPKLQKKKTKW